MVQLLWDQPGEHYFETGVDHGVLYPLNTSGVAWNGLTTISVNPSGGEATPYYLDGVKYLNTLTSEEFAATIEAFTYPDEFYACDGTSFDESGLGFEQQARQPFGVSYRTKVGNDVNGQDHGYKIHLIYNAMASPSAKTHGSIGDSVEALTFSWDITTTPILVIGRKAFSSLVIDSTKVAPGLLTDFENLLYGSGNEEPRLPSPDELVTLFNDWLPTLDFTVVDNGDGTFTVTSPDTNMAFPDTGEFAITSESAVFIDTDSYTISSL